MLPGHGARRAIHIHAILACKTDSSIYLCSHVLERGSVYFAGRATERGRKTSSTKEKVHYECPTKVSYSHLEEIICFFNDSELFSLRRHFMWLLWTLTSTRCKAYPVCLTWYKIIKKKAPWNYHSASVQTCYAPRCETTPRQFSWARPCGVSLVGTHVTSFESVTSRALTRSLDRSTDHWIIRILFCCVKHRGVPEHYAKICTISTVVRWASAAVVCAAVAVSASRFVTAFFMWQRCDIAGWGLELKEGRTEAWHKEVRLFPLRDIMDDQLMPLCALFLLTQQGGSGVRVGSASCRWRGSSSLSVAECHY